MEGGDDFAQGQAAGAERAAVLVGGGRDAAIAEMHDADMGRDLGQLLPLPMTEREMVGVVGQFQVRALVFFDEGDDRLRIGEKSPVGGAGGVHRLDRQRHFDRFGQWQQLVEREAQQPAGVTIGVVVAAAGIDHQATGLHAGRQAEGVRGVVDALFERAAVAAGEAAGPQQVGNRELAGGEQVDGPFGVAIGELLPPDADRPVAGLLIVFDVLFKRPAKGRDLVHREQRHERWFLPVEKLFPGDDAMRREGEVSMRHWPARVKLKAGGMPRGHIVRVACHGGGIMPMRYDVPEQQ